jgi:hypothetical protein
VGFDDLGGEIQLFSRSQSFFPEVMGGSFSRKRLAKLSACHLQRFVQYLAVGRLPFRLAPHPGLLQIRMGLGGCSAGIAVLACGCI